MLKDFYEYCKKNIWAVFLTTLFVFLTHGSRLIIKNATIDTALFINHPETNYNWFDIGRWGAVFTKNISELRNFNPYIANAFGILFIIIACVLWSFVFFQISQKDSGVYWLFGIVFFTNPVFSLQWLFYIQIFEVAFALCLIPISLLNIFQWIEKKNILNLIVAIIGMIWSFATYQSNVPVYIVGAITCFLLYEESNFKEMIKIILKLAISFIVAYLLYTIITKCFFSNSNYLDSQIAWSTQGINQCIQNILQYMKTVILGEGVFYTKAYSCVVILLMLIFFIDIKNFNVKYVLRWLAIFVLLLMPFALIIYMGTQPVARSQFALGAVIASGLILVLKYFLQYKRGLVRKILLCCVSILIIVSLEKQMYTSMKVYYSDDVRYQEDVYVMQQIVDDIYDLEVDLNKPLVFIGEREGQLNASSYKIEDIATEHYARTVLGLFSWQEPYYYHSTNLILDVYKTIGISFRYPSVEQINEGRDVSKGMKSWPKKGSIKETDDIIVVKLSKDIYENK